MTNNELHEEESCRNPVCSPPETLELDTCGNAAKENQTSGMNGFFKSLGVPAHGKTEKKTKNGFLTECGSIFSAARKRRKKTHFYNRPKKGKMYHENLR